MPVIAAVDQSARAERVVAQARDLAASYDVELHVVHVGDQTVGHTVGATDRAGGGIEAGRQEATGIATEIGEQVAGIGAFEAVGLLGDPADRLIEYSREQDAEYIVVSGRKRTRLDQAIFGGVTQALLLSADRPVVAVP